MIGDLRAEEKADIEARDVCDLEKNKLKNQEDDLQYNIDKNTKTKKRLQNQKEEVEGKIETIGKEIEGTETTMKEILDTRNEENEGISVILQCLLESLILLVP